VTTRQRMHILVSGVVLVLVEVDLIALQTDPVGYELLWARFQITFILHRIETLTHLVEAIKMYRHSYAYLGAVKWPHIWVLLWKGQVMGGQLRKCLRRVFLTTESYSESRLFRDRRVIIVRLSVQCVFHLARRTCPIENAVLLEDFICLTQVFTIYGCGRHLCHLTRCKRVHYRVVAGFARRSQFLYPDRRTICYFFGAWSATSGHISTWITQL